MSFLASFPRSFVESCCGLRVASDEKREARDGRGKSQIPTPKSQTSTKARVAGNHKPQAPNLKSKGACPLFS